MARIQELEKAVSSLPENEYKQFRQWFLDQDWKKWDRQIEDDSRDGKLDFLLEEADEAKKTNRREIPMNKHCISPVHSGVYLKELLGELKISQYRLARDLGVPAMRINLVVNGKRPVSAELALRLGRYFGQNPRYWINLQSRYDMDIAEDGLSERVAREVQPLMTEV